MIKPPQTQALLSCKTFFCYEELVVGKDWL